MYNFQKESSKTGREDKNGTFDPSRCLLKKNFI
jgi:hypothetical protein